MTTHKTAQSITASMNNQFEAGRRSQPEIMVQENYQQNELKLQSEALQLKSNLMKPPNVSKYLNLKSKSKIKKTSYIQSRQPENYKEISRNRFISRQENNTIMTSYNDI